MKEWLKMGLFDITDEKLQMFFHKAWIAANKGFVDPKRYPDLDRALYIYANDNFMKEESDGFRRIVISLQQW